MEIEFRALARGDLARLGGWLLQPHVQRWWHDGASPAEVEARYGPSIDGRDLSEHFVVEIEHRPVGMIQRYRLSDEPEWRAAVAATGTPADGAGIDYLIGEADLIGRGLGPQILAAFVTDTWSRYPEVPAIVVDVSQENRRSWRALEKVGFVRIYTGLIEAGEPDDDEPAFLYSLLRPSPATD